MKKKHHQQFSNFNHLPTPESDARCIAGEETSTEVIKEFIKRKRLQLIVHTSLYEDFHSPLITDRQWDEWGNQLRMVQENYPLIAESLDLPYPEAFRNWTGDTGHHLPHRLHAQTAGQLLLWQRRNHE